MAAIQIGYVKWRLGHVSDTMQVQWTAPFRQSIWCIRVSKVC